MSSLRSLGMFQPGLRFGWSRRWFGRREAVVRAEEAVVRVAEAVVVVRAEAVVVRAGEPVVRA